MENRELNKKLLNKQKWLKLEMTRVKLSPEQAVLSCCIIVQRAFVTDPFQCVDAGCGTAGHIEQVSS